MQTQTAYYTEQRPDIEQMFWREANAAVRVYQCDDDCEEFMATGSNSNVTRLLNFLANHERFAVVEADTTRSGVHRVTFVIPRLALVVNDAPTPGSQDWPQL